MGLELLSLDYVTQGGKFAGKTILAKLLASRVEEARKIMCDRLAKGGAGLKDIPDEEAAAIVYRYMRAAEEGAARVNLKLLSDVAVGQDPKAGFYANEFLMWADVLSSLKRDEIIVLGVMHREAKKIDYKFKRTGEFWVRCLNLLEGEREMPRLVADTLAASLLRTGLVTILGGLMDMGHAYMPTDNLRKLGEMADLERYYMEEPYIG